MSENGAYEGGMSDVVVFMNALRAAVPAHPDPRLGGTSSRASRRPPAPRRSRRRHGWCGRRRGRHRHGETTAAVATHVGSQGCRRRRADSAGACRTGGRRSHCALARPLRFRCDRDHAAEPACEGEWGELERTALRAARSRGHPGRRQAWDCQPGQVCDRPPACSRATREGRGRGDRPRPRQGNRVEGPDAARAIRRNGSPRSFERRWLVEQPRKQPRAPATSHARPER